MDSIEFIHHEKFLNCNEECTAEICDDQITSPGSPHKDDIYGNPLILPRLGDQYQVQIPPLVTEHKHDQLQDSPIKSDDILGVDCSSPNGLAIPIAWVNYGCDDVKHEQQEYPGTASCSKRAGPGDLVYNAGSAIDPKCSIESGFPPDSSNIYSALPHGTKPEHPDKCLEHGKELFISTSQEVMSLDNETYIGLCRLGKDCNPVPDLPFSSWTEAEVQSFLLGLYIFGKNLVQVKKFMESKSMGEILSFYYGKFYRSDAYRRWSECRKMRSRRCIYGQRIFTSWRQQELLSRLLPTISDEVRHNLLEVLKSFSEGRVLLEELVLNLKALVGMEVLVEAIGIGKGKHDLTGFVSDPVRANPVNPVLPIGKACSSLTNGDIIKFLTGGFRLSKARSNDIFWEAVWPRLLARGWHSEQPKGRISVGSKNALVFLVPGVKKFSRRKLVKGNHFFDSVADVLNKVAADPRLLELEAEGAKASDSTEGKFQWDLDNKLDQHCMADINSEFIKFTVVDTSLIEGEAQSKVRELRSLPVDALCRYSAINQAGEACSDSSMEQLDSSDTSSNDQEAFGRRVSNDKDSGNGGCNLEGGMLSDRSDCLLTISKQRISADGCNNMNDGCHAPFSDKNPVKDVKRQYNRRVKSGQPNCMASAPKRQKSIPCDCMETGFGVDCLPKSPQSKEEQHGKLKSLGVCQGRMPAISSVNASLEDGSECSLKGNHAGSGAASMEGLVSQEVPRPRTFIDLNLPHFPPDFETQPSSLRPEEKQQGGDSWTLVEINGGSGKQDPALSSRRQSTRNRPPTAKALEALACGFLNTKRKGRGTKASASSNLTSRLSHQTQKSAGAPRPASNEGNGEEYNIHKSHVSIFGRSFIQPERKEIQELVGML